MQSLGKWLQSAREARGLAPEDVEKALRIRVRYLRSMEVGDYDAMSGGEAQVRGFLRRYAAFLGLSPDEAISRYEREVHGRLPEVEEPAPPPARDAVSPARPLSIGVTGQRIWQTVAILALVVFLGVAGWWLLARFTPDEPPAMPVASQGIGAPTLALLVPGTVEIVPLPTETPPPTPVPFTGEGVMVILESLEHVWVRVQVDGELVFQGMLAPDAPQTWIGDELIVVETGNGAGVMAVVNGESLGLLGGRGQVVTRGWGPNGEVTLP